MKKSSVIIFATFLICTTGCSKKPVNPVPTSLEIICGGGFGGATKSTLENGKIIQSPYSQPTNKTVTDITYVEWQDFRNSLDKINVWNWPKSCSRQIFDGGGCSIKIVYADKTLDNKYSNSYPSSSGKCIDESYLAKDYNSFWEAWRKLMKFHPQNN